MASRTNNPHPPGCKIPVHTVDALDRIISFIEAHRQEFDKEVKEPAECFEILELIRNGRKMQRGVNG